MFAGDLQRGLAQADREEVLLTLGADLGHVGEGDCVEPAPWAFAVGLECSLVGDNGSIGVAQAVVDRGNRVEQVAKVGEIGRGPVDLQRLQQAFESLRIVAGLMMNNADEVQRPNLDNRRRTAPRQISGFEREPKGFVELTELIRHAGKPI